MADLKKEAEEQFKTLKEQREKIEKVSLEALKMFEKYRLSYFELKEILDRVDNLAKGFSCLKLPAPDSFPAHPEHE